MIASNGHAPKAFRRNAQPHIYVCSKGFRGAAPDKQRAVFAAAEIARKAKWVPLCPACPSYPESLITINTASRADGRRFLPTFNSYSGAQEEWYWGDYPWTQAKENDLKSFMLHLRNQTDEEVAWFLNNPEYELIQKKWNILIDYYKKEFGIDLRKMGNTTFE